MSLRLEEFSDRELLRLMQDIEEDMDGWVESQDIAQELQLNGNKYPNVSVGIRFAYLARIGLVERHPDYPKERKWRLSEAGVAYAGAKLRAALQRSIGELDEASMIEMTAALTSRHVTRTGGLMMRRQWQYANSRLRRSW